MQVNDLMRNSSNTNITWQLSAWLIRQSKGAKFSFATVCGAIFANVKLDFDTKNVSQAFTTQELIFTNPGWQNKILRQFEANVTVNQLSEYTTKADPSHMTATVHSSKQSNNNKQKWNVFKSASMFVIWSSPMSSNIGKSIKKSIN